MIESLERLHELPASWSWTTVGELYNIVGGGTPSTSRPEYWEGEIPWISSADIFGLKDIRPRRFINNEAIQESATNLVPQDSLLVVTRVGLGKVALTKTKICFSQDLQGLIGISSFVNPMYALYYLSSAVQIFKHIYRGTTIAGVTKKQLSALPFALPPLPEQHRIVAKIEELFSYLDAGLEVLQKARVQLKRYRQAVLKAAVEGKLTEEWRKAHPDVEPAETLIGRILRLKQEKLGKKFRVPNEVDTAVLPKLPDSWFWVRLESLADLKGGITKDAKRKVPDGRRVPYLRVANVQRGYLDLAEIKEIEASEEVISELRLEHGDILFNEGGDRDKLGRGWIWQNEIPECIHQNHVFRARLYSNEVSNKFVSWFGNTHGQKYFLDEGKQTTNLASVNLTKLSAFPVPLPPREEQKIIIERIEGLLSQSDGSKEIIDQSLKFTDSLRQSILKRAFEGKLVPQNPSYEPASLLLERIKAEKAKQLTGKGRKNNHRIRQMRLIDVQ